MKPFSWKILVVICLVWTMMFAVAFKCLAITEYYCPKCGSTDIEVVSTDPPPMVERVPMTEMGNWNKLITRNAVVVYSHYKAICKKCGFEYKYSTPYKGDL